MDRRVKLNTCIVKIFKRWIACFTSITHGVLQDSVLGALLFLLYVAFVIAAMHMTFINISLLSPRMFLSC